MDCDHAAQGQAEQWRRTRRNLEPMPEAFWGLVARLARQHSFERISRFVRLDYYAPSKRLDLPNRNRITEAEKRPAFVGLAPPSSFPIPEWVDELEHPRSGHMRIQVKGGPAPDLAALNRAETGLRARISGSS